MSAERWLARERDYRESCPTNGERWKPPKERAVEKKAKVLTLSEYGATVIDQRVLKPRTRLEYEAKWSQLIEPKLGRLAVRDITTTAVRTWYSALNASKPTRNSHAYGVLSMICNTAVRDGLLDRNPCQIVRGNQRQAKAKGAHCLHRGGAHDCRQAGSRRQHRTVQSLSVASCVVRPALR